MRLSISLRAATSAITLIACAAPAFAAVQDRPPRMRPNADGSMMAPPAPLTVDRMLERSLEQFDRLDANHDGVLTQAEIQAGSGDRGPRGGPGGRMLQGADADGDGQVSRAEVEAAVRARFDQMDANHDGVITRDEMPQRPPMGG